MRQIVMLEPLPHLCYVPKWRTKSCAAKRLRISRKTIQRKVRQGLLAEDGAGRVCFDRLMALLEMEQRVGRRGPKIAVSAAGLGTDTGENDQKERQAIEANIRNAAEDLPDERFRKELVRLDAISLRKIADDAITILAYRERLAKLAFVANADQMSAALSESQSGV